jgi:ribonuclease E
VSRPARSQPPEVAEEPEASGEDGDETGTGAASRRRRRGGRGRGKGTGAGAEGAEGDAGSGGRAQPADSDADDDGEQGPDDGSDETTASGKRRRRRRRSTGGDPDGHGGDVDDPPNTVVHVRPPRATSDNDVRAVKGSTRLEAKRQRRREGRESGRRRPPIITESEFLARREAVERVMVVRQHGDRTQIAVLEDGVLVEHYVDKASHQSYVGNVYLGKVQNVLPSMEAAFVDIGKGRNAVLYAGEVNFDASGLEGESKRIESALKSGQSILVQVTKDPIGHKGARLTSQVSLPGRYLVYVPGAGMTGISRKLPDTERSRLKQILKHVMPENAGVIVRTAAEGASEEELSRDVARLAAQWEAIEKKSKTASAPDLLYGEPDLTLRVIRDIFNEDFSNLIIASDSEWDLVDEYVRYVAPHLSERMQRWDDDKEVFAAYRIDEQLAKALERKVWLPSGGSLVIDHTEAMTVIDVNTGKFTGQGGNLEQTVTRNNLEAAEEIVRQLRLRDLGGIIVIDFIDMVLESNRELVLRRLLECLARDRTKHQVAEVTSLGLVQMTRKRVGSGLLEAFSVPCEHCNGRGVIMSIEPVDHSHRGSGRDGDGHGKDGGRGGKDASSRNGSAHGGRGNGPKAGQGKPGGGRGASDAGGSADAGGPADTGGLADAGSAETSGGPARNGEADGAKQATGRSRGSRGRSRSGGHRQDTATADSGDGNDAVGSGTESGGGRDDSGASAANSGGSGAGVLSGGTGSPPAEVQHAPEAQEHAPESQHAPEASGPDGEATANGRSAGTGSRAGRSRSSRSRQPRAGQEGASDSGHNDPADGGAGNSGRAVSAQLELGTGDAGLASS